MLDPELSDALHDEYKGFRFSAHPWTVSPLKGPLRRERNSLTADPSVSYRVRITALVPAVLELLAAAFDIDSPLGREPLILEYVPFHIVPDASYWDGLKSYASLLNTARPERRIALELRSPTAFRSQGKTNSTPTPLRCVQGYVRKWNAFADVELPEEALLEFVEGHVRTVEERLNPRNIPLAPNRHISGVVGKVVWECDGESPAMLRLLNALADYAVYCGTGISTAQGMGQTARLNIGSYERANQ